MQSYNSPEQIAELLESQDCGYFTVFHSNKRDIAFRYSPESTDIAKAKETILSTPSLIGPGKFWVELKPKRVADKGTVVKVWMQTSSLVPSDSQTPAVGSINQFDAHIEGLISKEVEREKKRWDLERKIEDLQNNKPDGVLQQLMANPQVMNACQQIIMGLASSFMGQGRVSPAISGFEKDNMNAPQQTEEQQANIDYNRRVLTAAGKIQQTVLPWGHDVAGILENLAVMAEKNPNKLKQALSFL